MIKRLIGRLKKLRLYFVSVAKQKVCLKNKVLINPINGCINLKYDVNLTEDDFKQT